MRRASASESYNIEDSDAQKHTSGLERCSVVTLRVSENKGIIHKGKEEIKIHPSQQLQSTVQSTELYNKVP